MMQRSARGPLALAAITISAALLMLTGCAGQPDGPAGSWGEKADGKPRLELADGGKLTGTDGCNRLAGTWKLVDGELVFDQVLSTMMACPDTNTWLSGLATGEATDRTLTVFDQDGTEIGELTRSP